MTTVERRRREQCRRAGLESGRKRRQQARRRRGIAPGQPRLELSYEHRQPGRREFERRYERSFPCPESPQGAAQWQRGRQTAWEHLIACWRLTCVEGQHCKTTKPQRARALANRGRARCTRTVRRLNIKLERLGYAALLHHRAPAGRKDYLVCEWRLHRALDVIPPSGTGNPRLSAEGVPRKQPQSAPATRAVPPDGGDQRRAASPPGSDENDDDAQLSFDELRAQIFEQAKAEVERRYLRRPSCEPGRRGSTPTDSGDGCSETS